MLNAASLSICTCAFILSVARVEMTRPRQGVASLKCDDLLITLYAIV